MICYLLLVSAVFAGILSQDLQELLKTSEEGDYMNLVTCKRPSIKTMVQLWEAYPDQCIQHDENSYLSVFYEDFIHNKASELKEEFIEIWGHYMKISFGADSWRPIKGEGVDNKAGTKRMLYNNIDTVYLLGSNDQLEQTIEFAVKNVEEPKEPIDIYEFVTKDLGGLLSGYYLSKNKELLEKAKAAGEFMLLMYQNWFPFTKFDFKTNKGTYGSMPIRNILNLNEMYMLYHHTHDPRYKTLIDAITMQLEKMSGIELLPQLAYIENNTLLFEGYITADHSSSEVARILYNNWILSNKTATIFKYLYDKTKEFVLKKLPYESDSKEIAFVERTPDAIEYRMNLKMCGWVGILAQQSTDDYNATEIKFAERLISSCFKFFGSDSTPSDYIFIDKQKGLSVSDNKYSISAEPFESLYFLFKATGKDELRKVGHYIFKVFLQRFKRNFGYTIPGRDLMPEDFLSKTMKYLSLIYNESTRFNETVFTNAGHLLGYDK